MSDAMSEQWPTERDATFLREWAAIVISDPRSSTTDKVGAGTAVMLLTELDRLRAENEWLTAAREQGRREATELAEAAEKLLVNTMVNDGSVFKVPTVFLTSLRQALNNYEDATAPGADRRAGGGGKG